MAHTGGTERGRGAKNARAGADMGGRFRTDMIGMTGAGCRAGAYAPGPGASSRAHGARRRGPGMGRRRTRPLRLLALPALLLVGLGGLASVPAQAGHLVKPTDVEARPTSFVSLFWTQTDPTTALQDTPSEIQHGEHPNGALSVTRIFMRSQTRAYSVRGLKGATTYRFRIRAGAYGAHAAGPWSDWVTATTEPTPLPRDQTLTKAPGADGSGEEMSSGGEIGDEALRSEFCGRFPELCRRVPDGLAAGVRGCAVGARRRCGAHGPGAPQRGAGRRRAGADARIVRGPGRSGEAGGAGPGGAVAGAHVQPASWRDVSVRLAGGRGCGKAGAVCASGGRMLSNSVRLTVGGPVRIRVADGKAREGRDESLEFAVTLSRAAVGRGVGGLRDQGRHGDGGGGLHDRLGHARLRAGRDGEDGERGDPRRRHRRGQGDVQAQALEPARRVFAQAAPPGEGGDPELGPAAGDVAGALRAHGGLGRGRVGDGAA